MKIEYIFIYIKMLRYIVSIDKRVKGIQLFITDSLNNSFEALIIVLITLIK